MTASADAVQEAAGFADEARRRIASIVSGQDEAVTHLLVALGAEGHIILDGMPGLGKTTLARTFAHVTDLDFKRVQLTPDLLPADITGHTYFDQSSSMFRLRKGPVFTQVLLADELNRTPPRTQAALLEVMQERQVTIDGTTHRLDRPFLVVATKNPLEVEGVYPLPEAELDRFLIETRIGYLAREQEAELLDHKLRPDPDQEPLSGLVAAFQAALPVVTVHPDIRDYILDIVQATRRHDLLDVGASSRAAVHLQAAARAYAVIAGRDYVIPDDIQALVVPVLAHRLLLSTQGEVEGVSQADILVDLLTQIPVPVAAKA